MKKVILLIVALVCCGSIFAQYEPYWEDINEHQFWNHDPFVAMFSVDNHLIGHDDNFAALEVAAFVTINGTEFYRGHGFLMSNESYGDPYPTPYFEIFYKPLDNENEQPLPVHFKLYDHSTQTLYDYETCDMEILTQHSYGNTYDFDNMPTLSFFHTFTKEIDPWTNEGGFYLIASPLAEGVSPTDVLNMTANSYDLYAFDQAAEDGLEWRNYKADAFENLVAGTGYLYANSTGADITFIGAPNSIDEDVEIPLTKVDGVEFSGWNLVGNPFPQKAYIDRTGFYVMNPDGRADVIAGEGNEVGPMQGIFVIAANNSDKVTFSAENPGTQKGLVINVHKDRGAIIDRAIVRFGEGGLLPKFMLNESHTKLYIPQNDKEYAVVTTDTKTNEIPLNFKAAEEGTYTMKFNTEDVETGYLHLIDNLTGNDVDLLANPVYTFDARLIDYASRFRLVFNDTFTNAIENVDNGSFAIINNGNLIINNVDGIATLEMIDITGRVISTETINGNCIKDVKVKAGVYTLRLIQDENVRIQKVVVE